MNAAQSPAASSGAGKTAVVIGAGIAGLASGALLAKDGWNVTILESRGEIGGRAGRWSAEGFTFDTGPSWFLMAEVFEHFYQLLGTSTEEQLQLDRLDPAYKVFFQDGTDMQVHGDLERTFAEFERLEPGSSAALRRYLDSASTTGRLAVEQFLYNPFAKLTSIGNKEIFAKFPTLAKLLLQPMNKFIAKHVRDPRLQQVLGYPAVFLGTSPYVAPSMYHLMSTFDMEEGVFYPQGGFAAFIDSVAKLAREAGAEIVLNSPVVSIKVDESGTAKGVIVRTKAGESEIRADLVVSGADRHHTETKLIPKKFHGKRQKQWDKRTAGPSAVVALLGIKGRVPELPHHSLFFTSDWKGDFKDLYGNPGKLGDPANFYVCAPSVTDDSVAPADHENLFVLVPVPADESLGRGGTTNPDGTGGGDPRVEQITDSAIATIAEWAGIPDLAERIVVRKTIGPADYAEQFNSWKASALGPSHILSQSAMFRGSTASPDVDGLVFAGATSVPGIGLPMCLISAELVLKHSRGDRDAGRVPAPIRVRQAQP
ncbi:phytoene desaturase family protein [Humidisolicoccus flavus]|uniref:phytoene desaturase family protein n=1 Tax=Humidisolicoccus flavus TaxID=3111414 RepID=UPI003247190D